MRVRRQGGVYAFSHVTAAAVHDLPVARRLLERVTLTVDPTHGAGTRYAGDYARQVAPLTSAEIVNVRGLLVDVPGTDRRRLSPPCPGDRRRADLRRRPAPKAGRSRRRA